MGTFESRQKQNVTMHEKKNLEFNLLISDSFKVSCKFEMLIIEKAQVTKHYVQFVILFVNIVCYIELSALLLDLN